MKPLLRVLVVEDHSLFADALSNVLAGLARRVQVHVALSAEDALRELDARRFDLVLLDLGLPKMRGRAAFDAIRARAREAPVVLVTAAEPSAQIHELVREGARGFVHKRAKAAELLAVLRLVLDGGTHVPAELLQTPSARAVHLTTRQREVLTMLARGLCNKDIANALQISEATVRVHVSSVMRVLEVENRTQAATSPLARRLIEG